MTPSLLVPLSGIARTLAISVPTVVDAVRGRVTVERCDERLRRWARGLLDHAEVTRVVLNLDRVPSDETFILMSNHRSLYDVPLLIESFPRTLRMVTKSELFRVPIWGPAMREAGFIEMDRKNSLRAKEGLEIARTRLSEGINVWIAPEGTRSRTGELGAFKSGGFRLALGTGLRILPVAVRGTERILRADGMLVTRGASVELEFGAPVDPAPYGNAKRAELVNVIRDAILAML
jgi:1-acyl-sn-glycerol-3-phosphate acyltransferase